MAEAADAELVLKLYELRREPVLRQAREWFVREFHATGIEEMEALCPAGSEANRFFRMVTSYWEMAAALVVHGALDEALFVETSGECLIVWRRMEAWIEALRAHRRHPRYLRNIEEVAQRAQAYFQRA